jgi:predicted RNase H-like nuclease
VFAYAFERAQESAMQAEAQGSTTVAGADGCPRGWLLVTAAPVDGGLELRGVQVVPDFAALLQTTAACAALAVDIPIGLAADGRREADLQARKRLGVPRSASVFPTPARMLLGAATYAEANRLSWTQLGRGLPAQTYGLFAKLREADACMTPEQQAGVTESHPEVCFWALNGDEAMRYSKRTSEGRAERLGLLENVYGPAVRNLTLPRGAAWDDLYDACVLAWTAAHVAAGTAVHLPSEPQRDARGLRMEIVY